MWMFPSNRTGRLISPHAAFEKLWSRNSLASLLLMSEVRCMRFRRNDNFSAECGLISHPGRPGTTHKPSSKHQNPESILPYARGVSFYSSAILISVISLLPFSKLVTKASAVSIAVITLIPVSIAVRRIRKPSLDLSRP